MHNLDSDIKIFLSEVKVFRFDDDIVVELNESDAKGSHRVQARLSRSDVADLIEFLTIQFDTMPH